MAKQFLDVNIYLHAPFYFTTNTHNTLYFITWWLSFKNIYLRVTVMPTCYSSYCSLFNLNWSQYFSCLVIHFSIKSYNLFTSTESLFVSQLIHTAFMHSSSLDDQYPTGPNSWNFLLQELSPTTHESISSQTCLICSMRSQKRTTYWITVKSRVQTSFFQRDSCQIFWKILPQK